MVLELDRIQGRVVPGFNKQYEAFVLVEFSSGIAGREWLRELRHDDIWEITTADEVAQFKTLRKRAEVRRRGEEASLISSTWLNVAFSRAGLQLLLETRRTDLLGDARLDPRFTATHHAVGRNPARPVHALVIIAADRPLDLDREVDRQVERLTGHGLQAIETFRGHLLRDGREHFGYRDGLSQPPIMGAPQTSAAEPGVPLQPGEFVLGYPDELGERIVADADLTRNGSFLVFLKLKQDVAGFATAIRDHAAEAGLQPEQLGAALVGRNREGQHVGPPFERLSHITRAHPEPADVPDDPQRHRILRRGIPYGPALGTGADDEERGLLFVAYQADIVRQFQHVWEKWLHNPNFPDPDVGRDPLVGPATSPDGGRAVTVARGDAKGGTQRLTLTQFVTPQYGGYFFTPSTDALARLAGLSVPPDSVQLQESPQPMPPRTVFVNLTGSPAKPDYLDLVLRENPYDINPDRVSLPNIAEVDGPARDFQRGRRYPGGRSLNEFLGMAAARGDSADALLPFPHWRHNNQDYRISKSMLLTYNYNNPADAPTPAFSGIILIGYGGPVWGGP